MLHCPGLDQGQGGLSVGLGTTQQDEIVTVADDHIASVGHDTDPTDANTNYDSNGLKHRPLWHARLAGSTGASLPGYPGRGSVGGGAKSVPVTHLVCHPCQEGGFGNRVEVLFHVNIDHPGVPRLSATDRLPARRLYSLVPVGSHSYTGETPVQRSLKDQLHGRLHNTVFHRRDAQGTGAPWPFGMWTRLAGQGLIRARPAGPSQALRGSVRPEP